ncbi:MAG: hypothetical protein GY803_11370 [Chloroflexi bacterium]|nr:hypothetical protein [Chloroflexota bacterium]
MDIRKESYLMTYRRQEHIAGLETKRQIKEALDANKRDNHILAIVGHILKALGNVRKNRIEISLNYNDPHPKTTGC